MQGDRIFFAIVPSKSKVSSARLKDVAEGPSSVVPRNEPWNVTTP